MCSIFINVAVVLISSFGPFCSCSARCCNVNTKADVDKKNQLGVTFVFFISLLLVAQHVSGNHVEQLVEEK